MTNSTGFGQSLPSDNLHIWQIRNVPWSCVAVVLPFFLSHFCLLQLKWKWCQSRSSECYNCSSTTTAFQLIQNANFSNRQRYTYINVTNALTIFDYYTSKIYIVDTKIAKVFVENCYAPVQLRKLLRHKIKELCLLQVLGCKLFKILFQLIIFLPILWFMLTCTRLQAATSSKISWEECKKWCCVVCRKLH